MLIFDVEMTSFLGMHFYYTECMFRCRTGPMPAERAVRRGTFDGISYQSPSRALDGALLQAYLVRLGISSNEGLVHPSLTGLRRLLSAHVNTVAYENLDLCSGPVTVPALNPVSSAHRIAHCHRGGYCFLVVDAFVSLLCSLGYTVSLHTVPRQLTTPHCF